MTKSPFSYIMDLFAPKNPFKVDLFLESKFKKWNKQINNFITGFYVSNRIKAKIAKNLKISRDPCLSSRTRP